MSDADTATQPAAESPPEEPPPVESHKPKPVHNWRELLTEIGVVVIGVGIALAGEQTVEWFHWRQQVADAREVISTELNTNLVGAITRVRIRDCAERRLDALSLILDEAAKKGSLPPVGEISIPPRAGWPSGAWESVMASQTAAHFPRRLLADMAFAYKLNQRLEDISTQELLSWEALFPIVGPGRRLDPASEASLRQALSSARTNHRIMVNVATQLIERVSNLHLRLGAEERDLLAQAQNSPLSQYPICRPIGAVPSSYGQSYRPSGLTDPRIENALKSLRATSQARDD